MYFVFAVATETEYCENGIKLDKITTFSLTFLLFLVDVVNVELQAAYETC